MLPSVELAQKLLAAARSFLQHILIYYGFIGKDNVLAALQIYQLLPFARFLLAALFTNPEGRLSPLPTSPQKSFCLIY